MGEKIVGNQERGKGKEDDSSLRVCQPMPFTLEKKRNSYMPRALHDGPHKQVTTSSTTVTVLYHFIQLVSHASHGPLNLL